MGRKSNAQLAQEAEDRKAARQAKKKVNEILSDSKPVDKKNLILLGAAQFLGSAVVYAGIVTWTEAYLATATGYLATLVAFLAIFAMISILVYAWYGLMKIVKGFNSEQYA